MTELGHQRTQKMWVVVEVQNGIPTLVRIFDEPVEARAYENNVRQDMHPENDETGIFEVEIPRPFSTTSSA